MHRAMTTEFKMCWKGENKEEIECMQGGASGGEIRHRHFFQFSFFISRIDSFFHGYIPWLDNLDTQVSKTKPQTTDTVPAPADGGAEQSEYKEHRH